MSTRRTTYLPILVTAVAANVALMTAVIAFADGVDKRAEQPFAAADVVTGTAHERGETYGKRHKDDIHEFLDREIYAAFLGKPYSKDEMLEYAKACGEVTREVSPLIAAECKGIATGAGLSYEEIILINLHEELHHMPKKKNPGHCTGVAIAPSDSGDGHTYVGQTWDWMTSVAGKSSIVEWQRKDGPSVLSYGFPGMPMGAGINSNGIALCWTSGIGSQTRHPGVPSYLLIGHLLAQPDLESVIREANRNKQAGIFTFVVADADGNLLNIEGTPDEIAIERPKDRLARAYFGTRQMTRTKPGQPVQLYPRCQNMYNLLEKTTGKNDLKMLQHYFTEHEYEILQWESPRAKTIDIMVFDTTARTVHVTRGPDFHLEWREFGFHARK
jgi:hypothetical protein